MNEVTFFPKVKGVLKLWVWAKQLVTLITLFEKEFSIIFSIDELKKAKDKFVILLGRLDIFLTPLPLKALAASPAHKHFSPVGLP